MASSITGLAPRLAERTVGSCRGKSSEKGNWYYGYGAFNSLLGILRRCYRLSDECTVTVILRLLKRTVLQHGRYDDLPGVASLSGSDRSLASGGVWILPGAQPRACLD